MTDFDLAKAIATKFHKGQMYGKQPYMYHLEMVAESLMKEPDDRLPIIGILHDIIEDTTCDGDILNSLFEDNVVDAVVALTKGWVWNESYEDYIIRVRKNPLALIVKMHDTLCNLEESLVRRDMKRVIKYSAQMKLLAEG